MKSHLVEMPLQIPIIIIIIIIIILIPIFTFFRHQRSSGFMWTKIAQMLLVLSWTSYCKGMGFSMIADEQRFMSDRSTGWKRESIGHVDPGNCRIR